MPMDSRYLEGLKLSTSGAKESSNSNRSDSIRNNSSSSTRSRALRTMLILD